MHFSTLYRSLILAIVVLITVGSFLRAEEVEQVNNISPITPKYMVVDTAVPDSEEAMVLTS